MADEIETTVADHVCSITLNRPAKRNALTTGMIADLRAAVERAAAAPAVRVIVVRGAGAAFCAGLDLGELAAQRAGGAVETHALEHALEVLERCPSRRWPPSKATRSPGAASWRCTAMSGWPLTAPAS